MFDARLILAGQSADPIGTARSLADLFGAQQDIGMRQAQEQRTLADLATQRRRGTALRDLLSQAGPAPQARLAALQSNPEFFSEAMKYESHVADVRAKNTIADARGRDIVKDGLDQFATLFGGVADDADYQTRLASMPEQSRAMLPPTWAAARPLIESILNSPDALAKRARAGYDVAKTDDLRRKNDPSGGMSPADKAKADTAAANLERVRLENEKRRRELEAGGKDGSAPPPKESDIRSWSGRVPEGTRNIFSEVGKAKAIADRVGGIEKLAGVGLVGGRAPPQLLPKNEQEFRQHAAAAANAYRKIFAGAAVSPEEGAQINKAIAMVESGKTANEVATGLMILEGFADDGLEQAVAGASPAIKERIFRDIKPAQKKKGDGAKATTPGGGPSPERVTRTDPTTGETRAWDGKAWVKELE